VGFPGPSLDIRGDGGYVVAPPSLVDGRRYEVDEEAAPIHLPVWLLDKLRTYQRQSSSLKNATDWAKFVSSALTTGERDTRMTSYVGHLFAHGHSADEVFATARVLNGQVKPPLADKQLEKIVKSIAGREAA
jgi:hypothetical protein